MDPLSLKPCVVDLQGKVLFEHFELSRREMRRQLTTHQEHAATNHQEPIAHTLPHPTAEHLLAEAANRSNG
jgi:site-specific recombinase XerD